MIQGKFRIVHKLFYNEDQGFGIFAAEPVQEADKFQMNKYGNLTLKGDLPDFEMFSEHDMEVEEENSSKYGLSYNVKRVVVEKLKATPQSHQAVVKAALPQSIADNLIEAYPNDLIVDLFRDDKIDKNKVKGIGDKTLPLYKNILLKSVPIFEIMAKYDKYGVTFKKAKKMLEKYNTKEIIDDIFENDIYQLCEIEGFGFKTIDKIALSRGDNKTSDGRIHAFVRYKLDEQSNLGHSFMPLNEMIKEASKELGISKKIGSHSISEKAIKHVQIKDRIIFLEKLVQMEKEIMDALLERSAQQNEISPEQIDDKISFIEKLQDFNFTSEQREAVHKAVSNQIFILNGKAGVGKSTTLKAIVQALGDNYISCALSGRAAEVLNSMGIESMTIARLFGMKQDSLTEGQSDEEFYDTVIFDESSMVSIAEFHKAIMRTPLKSRIILVGDTGQLSGIGAGAVFRDLIKSKMFPMQELNKVHRQAEKSGILSEANKARDGQQIARRNHYGKAVHGELKDLVIQTFDKENKSKIRSAVVNISKNYKGKDIMDFQILTPLKQRGDLSSHELNLALQRIFNDNAEGENFVKIGKYKYFEGDKIIHNGNNYETDPNVFNGTFGIVKEVNKNDGMLLIDFDGVGEKHYLKSDLAGESKYGIELAYAISIHKSQGSGIKNVVLAFDFSSFKLLSRQLVYTGMTRAKSGCVMLCEGEALHYAIQQDHSESRRTTLYAQLKGKFQYDPPTTRYQDGVDMWEEPF